MKTQLIARSVLERAAAIRGEFTGAKPFRHVCIEDFLEPRWAETLLAEFPVFDPAKAINEFGKVGRKAVRTDLREISDHYREFYDYISSAAFLEAMSAMTGIPGLQFDERMYGGGTHENLEGQALDAHVDFNYDQERKLHRRINLLVYLNKEWDVSWGGAIQLHSDPRDWEHDQVQTFNCNFNRCVVFETNEHSWHGFRRIQLPADKQGLTRKCISIYLYTRERPAEEIVPVHGTFYVQRPLPERFVAGYLPGEQDLAELRQLTAERDEWIAFYQRMETEVGNENRALRGYAGSLALHNGAYGLLGRLPLSRFLIRPMREAARSRPGDPLPPFPPRLAAGKPLDAPDVKQCQELLRGRDRRIHRYQQLELTLRAENDAVHARIDSLLQNLRLPLGKGLRQEPGSVRGAYAGGWISSRLEVKLRAGQPVAALELDGRLPPEYPADMKIEARIDGVPAGSITPEPGKAFVLRLQPAQPLQGAFNLEVTTSIPSPRPVLNNDQRDLAFVLQRLAAV